MRGCRGVQGSADGGPSGFEACFRREGEITYQSLAVGLMDLVLHRLEDQICVRRRPGQCRGEHRESLQIEHLSPIVIRTHSRFLVFFWFFFSNPHLVHITYFNLQLTRSSLEYTFGSTLLAIAVDTSNCGMIAIALISFAQPNLM